MYKNYQKHADNNYPHQGDIVYVNEGSTGNTGSEQRSNRHAIVVSDDRLNRSSPVVAIVYVTTQDKRVTPANVDISLPWIHRIALCNQAYTVDKSRLERITGKITQHQLGEIQKGLCYVYGLEERSK